MPRCIFEAGRPVLMGSGWITTAASSAAKCRWAVSRSASHTARLGAGGGGALPGSVLAAAAAQEEEGKAAAGPGKVSAHV